MLLCLQVTLNNSIKYSSTNLSLNQILFRFQMHEILNLIYIDKSEIVESVYSAISVFTTSAHSVNAFNLALKSSALAAQNQKHVKLIVVDQYRSAHINFKNVIAFVIIQMKHYYNQKYILQFFCIDNAVNLQLH